MNLAIIHMRSISVILFFYGANSTDKTVTEARIAFVGPCFLNARMLVANLTYRQKTISQRFNSVVIGLIVGLIVGLNADFQTQR